jgi:hypothetical protein
MTLFAIHDSAGTTGTNLYSGEMDGTMIVLLYEYSTNGLHSFGLHAATTGINHTYLEAMPALKEEIVS